MKKYIIIFLSTIALLTLATNCKGPGVDPEIHTFYIYRNICSTDIDMKAYDHDSFGKPIILYDLEINVFEQDSVYQSVFGLPDVRLGDSLVITRGTDKAILRRDDEAKIFYRENYEVIRQDEHSEVLRYTFTDDIFE